MPCQMGSGGYSEKYIRLLIDLCTAVRHQPKRCWRRASTDHRGSTGGKALVLIKKVVKKIGATVVAFTEHLYLMKTLASASRRTLMR